MSARSRSVEVLALAVALAGAGCALLQPAPAKPAGPPSLAEAVRDAAARIAPPGTLAVAVFAFPERGRGPTLLGEYTAEKLMLALAETGRVTLVERSRLETVKKEQLLGVAGELDDTTAASIGNMAGAGAVAVGTLTHLGEDRWELSLRLLGATDARVLTIAEVSFSAASIPPGLAGTPVGERPRPAEPPVAEKAGEKAGEKAADPSPPKKQAATSGPKPGAVVVLSERADNTHEWRHGAPYVTTKTVANGEISFVPTGNNHFYRDLGVIGDETGELRVIRFKLFLTSRTASLVLQTYVNRSWEHRYAFDAREKYQGRMRVRTRGTMANIPVGEWVDVKLDLITDLGAKLGDKLLGLAFSGDDGNVVYDDVIIEPKS